jgi:CheY-like chemotaxis protein
MKVRTAVSLLLQGYYGRWRTSCRAIIDDSVRQICDLIQREQASLPVPESMTRQSPAAQQRALKILLIEDDPIDAAWITELIHEKGLGAEVAHSACLSQALLVLAQQPTDAVLISVHLAGGTASSEFCRELVSKAKGRPVVALVDVAELDHAADIHATGVRFIYGKHPIMRTAYVRKLEARERFRARITEHQ